MCIKCEIKKVVAGVVGVEVKEEVVGQLTADELQELRNFAAAEDKLEEQIKAALEEAAEVVKEQFKPKMDGLDKLRKSIWNGIYEKHELDPNNEYSVSQKTGYITYETMQKKEKQPEGVKH